MQKKLYQAAAFAWIMDNISELRHCSVEARCRMPCARKCHLSSRRIWLVFRDAFSFFLCQTTVPFALAGYRNSWLTGKEGKRISLSLSSWFLVLSQLSLLSTLSTQSPPFLRNLFFSRGSSAGSWCLPVEAVIQTNRQVTKQGDMLTPPTTTIDTTIDTTMCSQFILTNMSISKANSVRRGSEGFYQLLLERETLLWFFSLLF